MSAKVTYVIYWASRRQQMTSICVKSDLSVWNMQRGAMLEATVGATRGTAIGGDSHESQIPCLRSSQMRKQTRVDAAIRDSVRSKA